jgi:hypothetical protein
LPCALFRAHGKEIDCRVLFIGRTAKKKHTASKLFAVRQKKTHGKDLICRAFYFLAHGKDFSPTAVSSRQQTSRCEVSLPCVFGKTHGKEVSLPCAFGMTHGKVFFHVCPTKPQIQ